MKASNLIPLLMLMRIIRYIYIYENVELKIFIQMYIPAREWFLSQQLEHAVEQAVPVDDIETLDLPMLLFC
jgi:hypothetical protein